MNWKNKKQTSIKIITEIFSKTLRQIFESISRKTTEKTLTKNFRKSLRTGRKQFLQKFWKQILLEESPQAHPVEFLKQIPEEFPLVCLRNFNGTATELVGRTRRGILKESQVESLSNRGILRKTSKRMLSETSRGIISGTPRAISSWTPIIKKICDTSQMKVLVELLKELSVELRVGYPENSWRNSRWNLCRHSQWNSQRKKINFWWKLPT